MLYYQKYSTTAPHIKKEEEDQKKVGNTIPAGRST
jgi:hypothetical protein